MRPRHSYLFFLSLTAVMLAPAVLTQARQQKSVPRPSQSPLQGTTESLLVNGRLAVRVLSRKNGSTEISYQMRDGEDALVFTVMN